MQHQVSTHPRQASALPSTAQERLDAAKLAGYLITSNNRGAGRWLDECIFRGMPFVLIAKDRRYWRMSMRLCPSPYSRRWAFTPDGQLALRALAAEHSAQNTTIGFDYFCAYRLEQDAAKLIAAACIGWVRRALAEEDSIDGQP
jgi:hypothetical protein